MEEGHHNKIIQLVEWRGIDQITIFFPLDLYLWKGEVKRSWGESEKWERCLH